MKNFTNNFFPKATHYNVFTNTTMYFTLLNNYFTLTSIYRDYIISQFLKDLL